MMKSIEKILVPIDYSEPAFQAAWIGFSIAKSMQASMTLIHIHIREKALRELVLIDKSELAEFSEDQFSGLIQKLVGDPSYNAVKSAADHSVVEFDECTYRPSDEICDYARDKEINLIVMGSRIHSKIEDLILGSVSSEVLHNAPCPVTVVH